MPVTDCSGGTGEPRRPASGQARLRAHAGHSGGGCVGSPMCADALGRATGSKSEGAELRARVACDDLRARKSP